MIKRSGTITRTCWLVVLLLTTATAPQLFALERILVPTPPGGGEGVTVAERDMAIPGIPGHVHDGDDAANMLPEPAPAIKGLRYDDIGGDDTIVYHDGSVYDVSMDIADNGDIYAAAQVYGTGTSSIIVFRSVDGGTAWTQWATLGGFFGVYFLQPSLCVAEGDEERVYVAYRRDEGGTENEIHVTYSELGLETGAFTVDFPVLVQPGIDFETPRLASDAASYGTFYLYLVAGAKDGNGGDIWYARSTTQGASWETSYAIATLSLSDREYIWPDVCYGYGGYVHVSWQFRSRDGSFDDAIRYRRCSSFGGGGIGNWDDVNYMTSASNSFHERYPRVAAATTNLTVAVAYHRLTSTNYVTDPGIFSSADQGGTFLTSVILSNSFGSLYGFEFEPGTSGWVLAGDKWSTPALQHSTGTDPLFWNPIQLIGDRGFHTGSGIVNEGALALNLDKGNRAAVFWGQLWSSADDTLRFDAEWHTDPGYPNHADGFPIDIPQPPISEPALVDVDGNGTLEIVYSDEDDYVHVLQHDGTALPGWPVYLGTGLSPGPVAVGDLALNGEMTVVVGTLNGQVYAFDAEGQLKHGWPYAMPEAEPVYVSIGAVGPPYPRSVVAVGGTHLHIIGPQGNYAPGANGWTLSEGPPSGPAAIGNIDDDWVGEMVCAFGTQLRDFDRGDFPVSHLIKTLPSAPTEAVTLGDVDRDGDCEIAVPMIDGTLYLLDDQGADVPGWPQVAESGSQLSSVAFADNLGGSDLELAVAALGAQAHLYFADGTQQVYYPVNGNGWYIYGSVIMDMLADVYSSDVIVGARGQKAWAWSNLGQVVEGWPMDVDENIYLTGAIADIDLDGTSELVFLTDSQLIMIETNQVPGDEDERWPMYMHDARRTGCADCPEDLTTAVEDEGNVTTVSFAAPSPNPVSDGAVFKFATPERVTVDLSLFDLRGRMVRNLSRAEADVGWHVIVWDGRDADGRTLPSGHYMAKLRLRGPSVKQALVRKVVVLR